MRSIGFNFLSNVSVKCSYLLFNKEHAKEILLDAAAQKSVGNKQFTQSCMDILVIYGIKALVKSYLPVKDVQLRTGIDGVLEILRNLLLFGEIAEDINQVRWIRLI